MPRKKRTTVPPATTDDMDLISHDIESISGTEPASNAPASTARSRRNQPETVEIDARYLNNLPKMNFALLLALLMRQGGSVALKQRDLERADDTTHSILFALSLDGRELEVRAVSTESGIIRSPEAAPWETDNLLKARQEAERMFMPPAPPGENLGLQPVAADDWADRTAQFVAAAAASEPNRIVEMPPKEPKNVFPFEVGSTPGTAVKLSDLQNQLLSKDQQIAQQERAAAARIEGA